MSNFNFEYMGNYLQYKDSKGNTLIVNCGIINDTATGAVAGFTDGAENIPIKTLTVTLEPIQSGSGDPSPENLRPISGRQSVTVTRSGVNVWDEEWEVGGIRTNGVDSINTDRIRSKNYTSVLPNAAYYIHANGGGGRICYYDEDKNFISVNDDIALNTAFTTPDNCGYIRFCTFANYGATYNHDISINYPSTDHDYHPGTVASVDVQLGQTVYGGTVDVVSGKMVVDRAIVDMGSLYWAYSSGANPYFSAAVTGMKANPYTSANLYSSMYPTKPLPLGEFTLGIRYSGGAASVMVKDPGYSDAASFKTAMNDVQLVYELAEPITVQLTPEQLTTLLGTNYIWSDADSVSVDYVADTKLYIQNAISDAVSTI